MGQREGLCADSPQGHDCSSPSHCDLTSWWENKLGSKMHESVVNSQGNFTGKYHIAVLSTQKSNESSPLVSSQHLGKERQCTFSFTITGNFLVGICSSGRAWVVWWNGEGSSGRSQHLLQSLCPLSSPQSVLPWPLPALVSICTTAGHLLKHCLGINSCSCDLRFDLFLLLVPSY